MKRSIWFGLGALPLLLSGPLHAQSLTGEWQGVEAETGEPGNWPAVLRIQAGKGAGVFGVLYQELGGEPGTSVTFRMKGTRTAGEMRLEHAGKLDETGRTPGSYWCDGSITFTYDAALEKLTGHATYRPEGTCNSGKFTLYRVKLKTAATVPAGAPTTLRVSGRNVRWYADAALKQPLATGNTYRTTLGKTTTFYLAQDFYPTKQSPVVPITIRVSGAEKTPHPPPARVAPPGLVAKKPAPAAPVLPPAPAPVVLPTVLFRLGTPELMPTAAPALNQLATELKARPALRLRIAGYTDKVGEPDKNQALSEQRAEAVQTYLVQAGIAPERLSAIGYGDSRPLYPSPDARNRRVEVEELN